MAVTELDPGLHLITNLDLNDPRCPRIAGSYQLFAALLSEGAPVPGSVEFRARLRRILSAHDMPLDPRSGGFGNSLCLHAEEYGTRSSSIISLADEERVPTVRWTDGPPCCSSWNEVRAQRSAWPHGAGAAPVPRLTR